MKMAVVVAAPPQEFLTYLAQYHECIGIEAIVKDVEDLFLKF